MQKTERLELRITPGLKKRLQQAAEAEERSVSNYVEVENSIVLDVVSALIIPQAGLCKLLLHACCIIADKFLNFLHC